MTRWWISFLVLLLLSNRIEGNAPPRSLDKIAAIQALSREEARSARGCEFEAVVDYCDPYSFGFFVSQGPDSIFVRSAKEFLPPGTRVLIRGRTAVDPRYKGAYVKVDKLHRFDSEIEPTSTVDSVNVTAASGGIRSLPPAARIMTIVEVRSVRIGWMFTTINATWDDVDIAVRIPESMEARRGAKLVGAKIQITGNLLQFLDVDALPPLEIWCTEESIKVVERPASPIEYGPIESMKKAWDSKNAYFHLDGQVTCSTDQWMILQQGSASSFIQNNAPLSLSTGDLVQVVGFNEHTQNTTNLHSKVVLRAGTAPLPDPREIAVADVNVANSDGLRIKVRGVFEQADLGNVPTRIFLRADGRRFEVHLWRQSPESLNLNTARVIEATGTCSVYGAHDSDFIIHAPLADDVRVAVRTPFWTPIRLAMLTGLGLVVITGASRYWSLHRGLNSSRREMADLNAQLEFVFASVRDGIVIADEDGFVIHQNRRAAEILDTPINVGDEIGVLQRRISRDLSEGSPNLDWDELNESQTIKAEWAISLAATESRAAKNLDVFTAPIREADGGYLARLWFLYDVTEKSKFLDSLAETEKQQAIGRLAGGIAHDFNNLLTAIRASVEVASLDPSITKESRQMLDMASEAVDRAAVLVSQLLSYSRRTRLLRRSHDINELVQRLANLVTPLLKRRSCFSTQLATVLPPAIVDEVQLEQVLLNLCLNAEDAVVNGGEIVLATYLEQNGEASEIVISIRDTGCGMSQETLKHAFEPFFTTKAGQGSGLGLAMAQGIIEQHHGRITCESKLGEGTEFRIFLPTTEILPVNTVDKKPASESRLKGRCVMIVDDEPLVLRSIQSQLESLGANVIATNAGHEALDILDQNPMIVDLVLLDWSMPGMSGRDVLRKLKERHPALRVTVCTGNVSDVDGPDDDTAATPDSVLQKPFSPGDVAALFSTKST